MSLSKLIYNYTSYNEWANDEMVRWLLTLEEGIIAQKALSSFGSIQLTLEHITMAQTFWMQFISDGNPINFNWDFNFHNANSVLIELPAVSKKMKIKFTQFNDQDLIEKLALNQTWLQNSLCRYEYIIHVINHSTYHRGQIVTMARNLGFPRNIPNTDYNIFLSL